VAWADDRLGRRVGGEQAVAIAHGEDEGAGAVPDVGIPQAVPAELRRGRHRDLLQAELQAPVVHDHVEELGHVGLEHEGRHALPTEELRVDDPVGPGAGELPLGGLLAHPGDDEQIRSQGAGGDREEQVVGVRREGGHEHAGPLDPRRPQHTLIGGVALQGGDGQAGQAVGVAVDHHHVGAPGGDEGGDAAPDAPVAADDHVPGPVGDAPFHPPPPQELPELPVDHGLDETAQDVDRRAHAPEDQHHREQSLPGGHGLDLAEADRRDRGDGLVERVHRREAEEQVADRPRRRHEREGGQPEPGPAQGVHRRHPAARGGAVDDGQGPPSANWRT
jgi:hypothetical protein